jgi:peroxiredoxin Q/BCP
MQLPYAKDFSLPDQDGKIHTLRQYRGKWVVIYFYPKDDTTGCTKEACGFRDSSSQFQQLGVVVLGVSGDSVASHRKFANKYKLLFTLLSDESHEMIKSYKAWGKKYMMGREYDGIFRMTYIINPTGVIVKVYEKADPLIHSDQILADLKFLMVK